VFWNCIMSKKTKINQFDMNYIKNVLFILTTSIIFFACERSAERGNLLAAKGDGGEILLFIDSTKWKGELGKAVKDVFYEPLKGTLRDERNFTLRHISPNAINSFLKTHKNIIMVTSFESNSLETRRLKSYYTEESLKQIQESKEDSLFMLLKYDVFAQDQIVLFLFGKTDEALMKNLKTNKLKLQEIFESAEVRRLTSKVYAGKEQTNISQLIKEKHGFKIRIPFGYEEVVNKRSEDKKEGFLWQRILDAEVDKSVFIAYKPYTSEKQFENDSIIAWRNQICKQHIFGDPEKKDSTFVTTETLEPPYFKPITVRGRYTIETRGLWKTYNISMGGSFVSYIFADNKTGRLYYAEGFVYAPSKMQKREYLRELQVVLTSIE
jgi:hypothetical protein